MIKMEEHENLLNNVRSLPYSAKARLVLSNSYLRLGYPDLAAGEAYMALMLSDEIQDDTGEFYENAREAAVGDMAVTEPDEDVLTSWTRQNIELPAYILLAKTLLDCDCLRDAHDFCSRGLAKFPDEGYLVSILEKIKSRAFELRKEDIPVQDYPNRGFVRRQMYPWNKHEPNRNSDEFLEEVNTIMSEFATDLQVKVAELPNLKDKNGLTIKQLGVFAKRDLSPGDLILDEKSMLTASSRINDEFCDACGRRITSSSTPQMCSDCDEAIFCSESCMEKAMTEYHLVVCGKDLSSLSRNVPPAEAADSLYSLLVFRALSMAYCQGVHPLDLPAVRCIWADFDLPDATEFHNAQRSLPFSFQHNVLLPLNLLEKVFDVDEQHDIFKVDWASTWVFNTLYAKFRATASAKQGLDGLPEIGAVHPMWCLANHSCDPNVEWDWDGNMRFHVRKTRVAWAGKENKQTPGIKENEEILGHYCDIDLSVKERREWASGALGGPCLCDRCKWEAGEVNNQ